MWKTVGAALLSVVAVAAAQATESPIEGYGIEPIEWEFDPGTTGTGSSVRLNGTVEEVWLQLLAINPSVGEVFKSNIIASTELAAAELAGSSLQKRATFAQHNCYNFGICKTGAIRSGINYLRGIGGQPTNGPGPGNCGRVSCSENSGIWWCNDSASSKNLSSFASIADGAQWIVDRCNYGCDYTGGQAFHETSWNVIVRPNSC
ncbi:hypothetical protein CPLU01_14570 [Colletotrichum plurivorum]|uniref:Secreted protein n=1 Tax=Colletotrichum plurivorum TaxID=2175906 RepID=A0A8H6MZD3_9PEZI|nr:hypothetical protein CPLU01_14570 [Colletotrichum plurivorum]